MTEEQAEEPEAPPEGDEEETSHDKLFKAAFQRFLPDLVELVYPEVAANLDLPRFKFIDKQIFPNFSSKDHVEADLVAEVPSRVPEQTSEVVLVHVETERKFLSTIDERMARYGHYLTAIFYRPVISICLFLSGGPKGIEIRSIRQRSGPYEPSLFRYLAFGLSQSLAEEYVDRPQPLAAALASLMRSRIWDPVQKKLRCLEAISRASDLEFDYRFVLVKMVDTYIKLSKADQERLSAELARNKEAKKMVVTWEEALTERETIGETRGEARGRAEGKIEGKIEAAQDAVVISVRRRFVECPAELEEKIRAIHDLDRLYAILEQILTVESLNDLEL